MYDMQIYDEMMKLYERGFNSIDDLHELANAISNIEIEPLKIKFYILKTLGDNAVGKFPITFERIDEIVSCCNDDEKTDIFKQELEVVLNALDYNTFGWTPCNTASNNCHKYYTDCVGSLIINEVLKGGKGTSIINIYGLPAKLDGLKMNNLVLCSVYPYTFKDSDFWYSIRTIYGPIKVPNADASIEHILFHYDEIVKNGKPLNDFEISVLKDILCLASSNSLKYPSLDIGLVMEPLNLLASKCSPEFQKIYLKILSEITITIS